VLCGNTPIETAVSSDNLEVDESLSTVGCEELPLTLTHELDVGDYSNPNNPDFFMLASQQQQ